MTGAEHKRSAGSVGPRSSSLAVATFRLEGLTLFSSIVTIS